MFLKSEYFNKTVSEAAKLLPTRDKVESLLIHSGIPVESIKLTDTGISMWDSAISYADKNDKHLDLIDSILAEYPSEELEDVKTHILDKSAFIIELSYDDYITPSELPSTAKTFLIYDQKDYDEHVEDLLLQLRILEFPPSTILLYDMHDVAAGADVKETRLKNMGNSKERMHAAGICRI
jgi:hypothetical protein